MPRELPIRTSRVFTMASKDGDYNVITPAAARNARFESREPFASGGVMSGGDSIDQ
jgi:hypothetical protein